MGILQIAIFDMFGVTKSFRRQQTAGGGVLVSSGVCFSGTGDKGCLILEKFYGC